ncbi:hypothetical protein H4R33_006632 [Dimargaris cristalligena]|uniref:Uncharacterized protein n=1 Tax=Dimargaris cristalligena TaxID=215637 RepID=A0A4P9ZNP6_9FUNG|nr:hypothetical protein H4R33_006632 [Dimargaris cristalligena]RKP35044.1 hypothetical protein BJ085DRAFT_28669 [Dimargaris cristalligena]|eukprot:RKP35044.1 hypothetical protein BJ085DRAFT_28669 [Dimargaris cristalligena]
MSASGASANPPEWWANSDNVKAGDLMYVQYGPDPKECYRITISDIDTDNNIVEGSISFVTASSTISECYTFIMDEIYIITHERPNQEESSDEEEAEDAPSVPRESLTHLSSRPASEGSYSEFPYPIDYKDVSTLMIDNHHLINTGGDGRNSGYFDNDDDGEPDDSYDHNPTPENGFSYYHNFQL